LTLSGSLDQSDVSGHVAQLRRPSRSFLATQRVPFDSPIYSNIHLTLLMKYSQKTNIQALVMLTPTSNKDDPALSSPQIRSPHASRHESSHKCRRAQLEQHNHLAFPWPIPQVLICSSGYPPIIGPSDMRSSMFAVYAPLCEWRSLRCKQLNKPCKPRKPSLLHRDPQDIIHRAAK
jgi:hypothetical protein